MRPGASVRGAGVANANAKATPTLLSVSGRVTLSKVAIPSHICVTFPSLRKGEEGGGGCSVKVRERQKSSENTRREGRREKAK